MDLDGVECDDQLREFGNKRDQLRECSRHCTAATSVGPKSDGQPVVIFILHPVDGRRMRAVYSICSYQPLAFVFLFCSPIAILAMRPLRDPMLLMPSMPADRSKSINFSTPSDDDDD